MLIKCILYNEENEVIDNDADLSFFSLKKVILIPSDKEMPERLSQGKKIRFQIAHKYDKIFEGEIEKVNEEKIFLKNIKNIGAILHNDVRVSVDIPAIISYEHDDEYIEYEIRIRDISSGGMCFVCQEELDMKKTYETVADWAKTPIVVKIKLLRKEYDEYNKAVYGCKFIDLIQQEEFLLRAGVYYIQAKKFKPNRSSANNGVCKKMY